MQPVNYPSDRPPYIFPERIFIDKCENFGQGVIFLRVTQTGEKSGVG